MLIFPAIDLLDGKCVRLVQGDYNQVSNYGSDPQAIADQFLEAGAEWLHVVDLNAAKTGDAVNKSLIAALAKCGLNLEVGGGVRSMEVAKQLLGTGVHRVVAGTALVSDITFRRAFFELGEAAVAGIDALDGRVKTSGWTEDSGLAVCPFIQTLAKEGCMQVVLTDISRDGMLSGPNLDLLDQVLELGVVDVVQSGGIGGLADIQALVDVEKNNRLGYRLKGVITGKAIYEGKLDLKSALNFVRSIEKAPANS